MALLVDSDAPSAALARFDDEWAKTGVSSSEVSGDIPDGIYDAVIEDACVTETALTGGPVVVWRLRIQGPRAAGCLVTRNRVVTESTLGCLREDLEKCRLQVSRLSQLPARLRELVDRPIGVEKRTNDGSASFHFRWEFHSSDDMSFY